MLSHAAGMMFSRVVERWLWVKKGYPKTPIGKRKNRPNPVVPKGGIFLTHGHVFSLRLFVSGQGHCAALCWRMPMMLRRLCSLFGMGHVYWF